MPAQYVTGRTIHVGTHTEVLRARRAGGPEVALKRLREKFRNDAETLESFRTEIRISKGVEHANVVRVVDAEAVGPEGPFLVLELVDGRNLDTLLDGRAVDDVLAMHVVAELLLGLAAAHDVGVVHRDVTPRNVLVSWAGDVKLADFGIALDTKAPRTTSVGRTHGTTGFMSPEQAAGRLLDGRTDLYAAGVLLHWMCTGASPIADESARREHYAASPMALDAAIDGSLRAVIARAVEHNPERRFRDAAEMSAAVKAVLDDRATDDSRVNFTRFLEQRRRPGLRALFDSSAIDTEGPVAKSPVRPRTVALGPLEPEARTVRSAALDTDPLIGLQIHGYRVQERIGEGGTATVYRAEHEALGVSYAVKVLKPGSMKPGSVRRLKREGRLLTTLNHDNIVSVVDLGTLPDGRPFLTTAFEEGRSLFDVVNSEGPLSVERTATLAIQFLSGLAAAHDAGVIHRDLKLSNVIVGESEGREHIKIVDFGVARSTVPLAHSQVTSLNTLLGTANYIAPEQIDAPSDVTAAADMYAFGVCLFAMLHKQMPYLGTRNELLAQHQTADPPPIDDERLGPIIHELLAKSPGVRPSAHALLLRLQRLGFGADEGDTRATATATSDRTALVGPPGATAVIDPLYEPPPSRRGPIAAAVVLAIATAAVTVAVIDTNSAEVDRDTKTTARPPPSVSANPNPSATRGAEPTPTEPPPPPPARPPPPRTKRRAVRKQPAPTEDVKAVAPPPIDAALLERALSDAADLLEAVAGRASAADVKAFERRYFELRVAARKGGDNAALLRRIRRLERDLVQAAK